MKVSIQVSIYPLGTDKIDSCVLSAIDVLKESGLKFKTSSMSTIISCELAEGMETIQKLFESVASSGKAVMNVTVSNACGLDG